MLLQENEGEILDRGSEAVDAIAPGRESGQ